MKYNQKDSLRTHKNCDIVTGTSLVNPEHVSPSGICSICTMEGNCEVGKKAKTGETLFPKPFGTAQFGAEKKLPSIEDLQILPRLYGPSMDFEEIKTSTNIGSFRVSLPIAVASMGSTQVAHNCGEALAEGAARAGIPMGVGENVWVTYGEKELKKRIKPYMDNYEGKGALIVQLNENERKKGLVEKACGLGAHALEIKLGQGAKQELGGEIKFEGEKNAKKYREWGYKVIENLDGSYQRHARPAPLSSEGLEDEVLQISECDKPIWVKTGMGRGIIRLMKKINDINKEYGDLIEVLTVDGYGGGTGMSPWLIMNEMNISSGALFNALDFKTSFDVVLAGGFNSGPDIAKGMMLGAKGIAMGRSLLIAANTLQEGKRMGAEGVINYVEALKKELQMISSTVKRERLEEITGMKEYLIALSKEAEETFGIPVNTKYRL